jgi:hypothetical protein
VSDPSPVSDPNPDQLARGTDPWDPNPESDLNPDPDPLARGTDLHIRIRTKMSWIRNITTSFGIRPLKFVV